MYVRLTKLMAGPQGVSEAGRRIKCSPEVGKHLIDTGQAVADDGGTRGEARGKSTEDQLRSESESGEESRTESGGPRTPGSDKKATVGNVTVTYRSPLSALEALGVHARYISAAETARYQYVGQIIELSSEDLQEIDGISKKGALQIQAAAAQFE